MCKFEKMAEDKMQEIDAVTENITEGFTFFRKGKFNTFCFKGSNLLETTKFYEMSDKDNPYLYLVCVILNIKIVIISFII